MKHGNNNKCMDCGNELSIKNRQPVYSARLAVIGYRCNTCHDKSKSPETKKREEEISRFLHDIPSPENFKNDMPEASEDQK
jgi:hypothetical protein